MELNDQNLSKPCRVREKKAPGSYPAETGYRDTKQGRTEQVVKEPKCSKGRSLSEVNPVRVQAQNNLGPTGTTDEQHHLCRDLCSGSFWRTSSPWLLHDESGQGVRPSEYAATCIADARSRVSALSGNCQVPSVNLLSVGHQHCAANRRAHQFQSPCIA